MPCLVVLQRRRRLVWLLLTCFLCALMLLLTTWNKREGAVQVIFPVHQDYSSKYLMEVYILPALPAVVEGSNAQLVCIVAGASHVYFTPPALSSSLRSSVHTFTHHGGTVLTIEPVRAGHSGFYTCHAANREDEERTQTVELIVQPRNSATEHNHPSTSTLRSSHTPPTSPTSHTPPFTSSTSHIPRLTSPSSLSSHTPPSTSSHTHPPTSPSSHTPPSTSSHTHPPASPSSHTPPSTSSHTQPSSRVRFVRSTSPTSHTPPSTSPTSPTSHTPPSTSLTSHTQSSRARFVRSTSPTSHTPPSTSPTSPTSHTPSSTSTSSTSSSSTSSTSPTSHTPPSTSATSPTSQTPPSTSTTSPTSQTPPSTSPTSHTQSSRVRFIRSAIPTSHTSSTSPTSHTPPSTSTSSTSPTSHTPPSTSTSSTSPTSHTPPSTSTSSTSPTSHTPPSTSTSSTSPTSHTPPSTATSSHTPPSTSTSSHTPPSTSSSSHTSHSPSSTSPTSHTPPSTSTSSHTPPSTSHASHSPSSTSPTSHAQSSRVRYFHSTLPSSHTPPPTSHAAPSSHNAPSTSTTSSHQFPFNISAYQALQKARVDEFCLKHDLDDIKFTLPQRHEHYFAFRRHMLFDERNQVLFCFVPKVGCTNLKLLFFVSQGLIQRRELAFPRDKVNQHLLDYVMSEHSFLKINNEQSIAVMQYYFKFVMLRNPLERLASGYRSKVERFPLRGLIDSYPPYNWLRKAIYNYSHPQEYIKYANRMGDKEIFIQFTDFIDYWLAMPSPIFKVDEHFMLLTDICQPCRTRFNFYGNFHHFNRDAQVLIRKIGAKDSDLRNSYYSKDNSTESQLQAYYSHLSYHQKLKMLQRMVRELEFLYTLFPEERDSHKVILGVKDDLSHIKYVKVI